jgi:hypothetical protein
MCFTKDVEDLEYEYVDVPRYSKLTFKDYTVWGNYNCIWDEKNLKIFHG